MSSDFAASFFDYAGTQAQDRAFLGDRSRSEWAKVLAYTEARRVSAGELIISAGEADRSLYLLTEGTIGVRLAGAEETFASIDAPSVVGEMAFLDGGPRAATLFAIGDGELLRLRMERFEVLAAREPELGRAILLDLGRLVSQRLRRTNDLVARSGL